MYNIVNFLGGNNIMEESSPKNKLDYLKRLEYLQKQELKTRFAIKFSKEENNEAALIKFTNEMEEIQQEIDIIIDSLSKDTEIRKKYMEQWEKLNYDELKAFFGVKFANEAKNKEATEKFEKDLIRAKVEKSKIEGKLNSSMILNNDENGQKENDEEDIVEPRKPIEPIQTIKSENKQCKKESILSKLRRLFKEKFGKRNEQKQLPEGYMEKVKQNTTKEQSIEYPTFTEKAGPLYMDEPEKAKKKEFKNELRFDSSDTDSIQEIEDAKYIGDIECNVQSIQKTENDYELAKEYDDYEMDEDKRIAKEYEDDEI